MLLGAAVVRQVPPALQGPLALGLIVASQPGYRWALHRDLARADLTPAR